MLRRIKTPTLTKEKGRWLLGGLMVILALSQLFGFEELPEKIGHLFVTTALSAWLIAAALVVAEVFALPFLFGLKISPLFQATSRLLGWVAILMLLVITIREVATHRDASILLGTALWVPPGFWTIGAVLGLSILAIYTAWSSGVRKRID